MNEEFTYRSNRMFDLARECELPFDRGGEVSLENVSKYAFAYAEWGSQRDAALRGHVVRTPRVFRSYLPYNERVFSLAAQVLWYMDEIIVYDPVAQEAAEFLKRIKENLQAATNAARHLMSTLSMLWRFKESISEGYLLLTGERPVSTEVPDGVRALAMMPEVSDELTEAPAAGSQPSLVSPGTCAVPEPNENRHSRLSVEHARTKITPSVERNRRHLAKAAIVVSTTACFSSC